MALYTELGFRTIYRRLADFDVVPLAEGLSDERLEEAEDALTSFSDPRGLFKPGMLPSSTVQYRLVNLVRAVASAPSLVIR